MEVLRQRHPLVLDGQRLRMRIGDQHHPLAAERSRSRKASAPGK